MEEKRIIARLHKETVLLTRELERLGRVAQRHKELDVGLVRQLGGQRRRPDRAVSIPDCKPMPPTSRPKPSAAAGCACAARAVDSDSARRVRELTAKLENEQRRNRKLLEALEQTTAENQTLREELAAPAPHAHQPASTFDPWAEILEEVRKAQRRHASFLASPYSSTTSSSAPSER